MALKRRIKPRPARVFHDKKNNLFYAYIDGKKIYFNVKSMREALNESVRYFNNRKRKIKNMRTRARAHSPHNRDKLKDFARNDHTGIFGVSSYIKTDSPAEANRLFAQQAKRKREEIERTTGPDLRAPFRGIGPSSAPVQITQITARDQAIGDHPPVVVQNMAPSAKDAGAIVPVNKGMPFVPQVPQVPKKAPEKKDGGLKDALEEIRKLGRSKDKEARLKKIEQQLHDLENQGIDLLQRRDREAKDAQDEIKRREKDTFEQIEEGFNKRKQITKKMLQKAFKYKASEYPNQENKTDILGVELFKRGQRDKYEYYVRNPDELVKYLASLSGEGKEEEEEGVKSDSSRFSAEELNAQRAKLRSAKDRQLKEKPKKDEAKGLADILGDAITQRHISLRSDDDEPDVDPDIWDPTDDDKDEMGGGARAPDGLLSTEINELMQPYRKHGFKGVFAIDEIGSIPVKPNHDKEIGFVMNLDPSTKAGSHWVGVFISLIDGTIEYNDSYADFPPKIFWVNIKKLIDRLNPVMLLKTKINLIKQQAENSSECGYFAMRFLIGRFNGHRFKDVSGFSAVRKNEQQIKKFKERIETLNPEMVKFNYL